jgi:hypothetical protein
VKDGDGGIVSVGEAGCITRRLTGVFGKIRRIKNFFNFRYHFFLRGPVCIIHPAELIGGCIIFKIYLEVVPKPHLPAL